MPPNSDAVTKIPLLGSDPASIVREIPACFFNRKCAQALNSQIPLALRAELRAQVVSDHEGNHNADLWRYGQFLNGSVAGVAGAAVDRREGVLAVVHGPGRYKFVRSG